MTQQQVYDYGSSAVSRTYNLTYLTDSNYTSRYIRNRMTYATVTANRVTSQLAAVAYDTTVLGPLQSGVNYYYPVLGPMLGLPDNTPMHDTAYDTNFTYRGNPSSTWSMSGAMSYAYVVTGTPYKMQDGAGMAITVATDPSTNYAVPTALTPNSNSNLTSSMTYDATYSLTSVTGANGSTQGVAYDGLQRLASTSTPDGLVTAYSYTYGPNTQTATITTTTTTQTSSCPPATNCLLWNMSNPPTTTTTTSTRWTRNTLDGFGRTIKVETGHDSNVVVSTADTLYAACGCSPLGKPYKTSYPYGPGETEVWTTYTFDGSGRQLTSTAPDGSVTTTSYLGNTVTATDPAGIWKKNTMDAFGNAVAVSEPDPATGSASTGPVTSYTYNGANQIIGVSMTRGGVTQTRAFVWNGSDLVSETTPEAGTVSYTYDGNHHVTQRIDALNQKTAYTYDAYERLTMVQHYTWGFSPQCTSNCVNQWNEQASQDVSYYYDYPVSSDYTQNNTWGRLTGVLFTAQAAQNQPAFAYEYSYNQAGRVTGNRMLVKEAPGSPGLDLQAQYAWDTQGRMTSMTYPSGAAMTYGFDAMGRPITMTQIVGSQTCRRASRPTGRRDRCCRLEGRRRRGRSAWNGTLTPSFASVGETLTYNSMLQLIHLTGTIASAPSEVVPRRWTFNMFIMRGITMGVWRRRLTMCWARR